MFFVGLFLNNRSFGGVLADGLNAVLAGGLGGVALGNSDDLAVASLQTEAEFAALVLVQLELGMGHVFLAQGQVCEVGSGGALGYALGALLAGSQGLIDFGGSNGLAVGGLQVELKAGVGLTNNKLAHNDFSFSAPG